MKERNRMVPMKNSCDVLVRLTALAIVLVLSACAFAPMSATDAAQLPAAPEPAPTAFAPAPEEPDTAILQPNATAGKDTYITNTTVAGYTQYDNFGAEEWVIAGTYTGPTSLNALLQFSLPVGAPARIKSATLSLFSQGKSPAASVYGVNVSVFPLSNAWTEGTGVEGATSPNDANWVNSTTGTAWAAPGGTHAGGPESWINVSEVNAWYSWNVTATVAAWLGGTLANNGFLMTGSSYDPASFVYMVFSSSECPDPARRPKLTINYAAEISPPVPAQTFQEDEAARSISLCGRGSGTVEHVSFTATQTSSGTNAPFGAGWTDQMHVQYVYTPAQVGTEGELTGISFNKTLFSTYAGSYNNFRVRMAHTYLQELGLTFDANYLGYLTEVMPAQNIYVNSSNLGKWVSLGLNGNFTYDSSYNLLIDITWSGDSGLNVPVAYAVNLAFPNTMLYDLTGTALTGTLDDNLPQIRFSVDAVDNGIVDNGTTSGIYGLFSAGSAYSACKQQRLYNYTLINESGVIDELCLQAGQAFEDWNVVENFTIKLAHSLRTDGIIEATFDNNIHTPWVTVFARPSYNVTSPVAPGWINIDIDDVFSYDGIRDLLMEFTWQGGYYSGNNPGAGIYLAYMPACGNDCVATVYDDLSAPVALAVTQNRANLKLTFAGSADLTWSATSSDTSLFSAGVVGTNLVITPQADANGAGSIVLRLTNSNGESVTQAIAVTINAVNDDPILDPLSDIACTEDVPYALDIESYISDIDDPIENMTVSTDSDYATVNGTIITFVYPEGVAAETVTVTVDDGSGGSASQDIEVTVTMVNDDPWFDGFPWNVTVDATVAETVPLDPTDEESNAGQLSMFTGSQYASISGHALQLLYPKGIGTDTVTIFLVDNTTYGTQNNVSYVLNVTIIDHPEVTENTPEGTAVPVTTNVQATFDMPMNRTKAENAFSMVLGTTEVDGTFSWNAAGTVLTFTPADHLTNGVYVVRIAASAESETGIRMLAAFEWNFTAALGTFDGDGDGMPDQWEIDNGLDPNVDDASGDADADGLPNIYEYDSGLDPNVNDADEDADGDGATNLEEYEAGTDPNDPESAPSEFGWIIWVIIIVAVVAVVVLLALLMRRKKPAQAGPEPWQEPPQDQAQQQPYGEGQYPPPPGSEPPQPGQ